MDFSRRSVELESMTWFRDRMREHIDALESERSERGPISKAFSFPFAFVFAVGLWLWNFVD